MSRIVTAPITASIVTLAIAGSAFAATPLQVPGGAGWVTTGVTVRAGEPVSIHALGQIQTASIPAFLVPGVFISASGPAGQVANPTCGVTAATFSPELLATTGPCAVDDAYFGELVGRVGGTTFVIGAADSFVAPAAGTLELAANDLVNTYGDNRGSFTVVIR
ncbi:MAG TPA: LecA/PA-IL family lectin [Candidatus Limnocylindrales bacterium]|nr:LecA/PA-IL family lectin [Candidatus Limnocylindrales bacterium]